MKTERNEPCPCGSGKKYKKCCLSLEDARPSPAAHGGFRFEPGSYGGPTDSVPSIACLAQGSHEYRFVLVKPDAPLDDPDRACAVATADLHTAFARKAQLGRSEDVAMLLRERGYVSVDGFRIADAGPDANAWLAEDGLHLTGPSVDFAPEALEAATKAYQDRLRSSPLWNEMVTEFGEEKALALLAQCRVEDRNG